MVKNSYVVMRELDPRIYAEVPRLQFGGK